jgi:hypothetical protein
MALEVAAARRSSVQIQQSGMLDRTPIFILEEAWLVVAANVLRFFSAFVLFIKVRLRSKSRLGMK